VNTFDQLTRQELQVARIVGQGGAGDELPAT
jgi:hypothetical protein